MIAVLLLALPAAAPLQEHPWAGDVDELVAAVLELHPAPLHRHSESAWRAEAETLKRRLHELEPHEALLGMQRLLALAADGHTEPVDRPHPSLAGPWLPLIARRFADGWFVRTGHRRYAELYGVRLVALAGVPIEEVAARLRPFVSADNELGALDGIGNLMRHPAALHAAGITPERAASVELAGVDGDGQTVVVEVAAGPEAWVTPAWSDADADAPNEKPLWRRMDGNYSWTHLADQDLAYVWFDKVRDEAGGETIEAFFGRVLGEVRERGIGRLVLDLRENSGGNLDLSMPVLHGLVASPVNRPGHLFVAIGRDTYSAAMHLAVELERHTHALFVGEPTGSRPNFSGDTLIVTLPRSGLAVEISELWWQPSHPRDPRPWITPDLPAPLTSEAFFARRDPVLEAILAHRPDDAPPGPTVHRWRRANQLTEERWPGVVEAR